MSISKIKWQIVFLIKSYVEYINRHILNIDLRDDESKGQTKNVLKIVPCPGICIFEKVGWL